MTSPSAFLYRYTPGEVGMVRIFCCRSTAGYYFHFSGSWMAGRRHRGSGPAMLLSGLDWICDLLQPGKTRELRCRQIVMGNNRIRQAPTTRKQCAIAEIRQHL